MPSASIFSVQPSLGPGIFFFCVFCNIFGMDVIGIDIQRAKSSRARVFFILFFGVFYLFFAVLFFLATNMMVMG
jgi:hypothetical protein